MLGEDNFSMWEHHQARQDAWVKNRPICACCGEHIQDDECYPIPGYEELIFCPNCMEYEIKRATEDFCS